MAPVNDGTGPRYDRPSRITRETRRRREPAEPEYPEWDAYQALLAEGWDDAEARLAIWPDNALLWVEGEGGDDVLLPVGKDGLTILPEGVEADPATGEPLTGAEGDETPDATQTPTEPETGAQTGADGLTDSEREADANAQAARDEIAALNAEADGEPDLPETASDEGYEPGEHTRDEVVAYLAEHPDQREFVLDRERTGKARVSLIGA